MSFARVGVLCAALGGAACGGAAGVCPPPSQPATTLPACAPAPPPPKASVTCVAPHTVIDVEGRVAAAFSAGDGKLLRDLYGPDMRAGFTADQTSVFVRDMFDDVGPWRSATRDPGEDGACEGSFTVHAERRDVVLKLVVMPDGQIAGLRIIPMAARPPPVVQSDIPLALPFRGEWSVDWGGDTAEVNHHVGAPSQRRAADLAMRDASGRSFRTDGKTNADYLVYGQPVLAVADGVVVTAVDGVPENVPGTMSGMFVPGNVVIVQHGPRLFSVYAHLQPGSVKVKAGARVKRGAALGLCGNSGHSSEPHLHFQLQDGPSFEDSWGVEAVFGQVDVTRGGQTAAAPAGGYTFLRGDRIRPR